MRKAHILVSFFVLFCVCFLKRAEAEEPVNPFQGSQHSENLNCFGDFSLCLSFSQLMFIILPIEYSDFVLSQYLQTTKLSLERLNIMPKLVYLGYVQHRETLGRLCNQ